MGKLNQPLTFTWDPKNVAIMLGIEYIGDIDELMIFDRALAPEEIGTLLFNLNDQPNR